MGQQEDSCSNSAPCCACRLHLAGSILLDFPHAAEFSCGNYLFRRSPILFRLVECGQSGRVLAEMELSHSQLPTQTRLLTNEKVRHFLKYVHAWLFHLFCYIPRVRSHRSFQRCQWNSIHAYDGMRSNHHCATLP